MKNISWIVLIVLFLPSFVLADDAYRISVNISGMTDEECFLGYHFGDKRYLQDTAAVSNEQAVFTGEQPLKPGVYFIYTPNSIYFEVLITEDEQQFSLTSSKENLVNNLQVEGSPSNALFNSFQKKGIEKQREAAAIQEQLKNLEDPNGEQGEQLRRQLQQIDQELRAFRKDIADNNPGSLVTKIIRGSEKPALPEELKAANSGDPITEYLFYRDHYFDNIDLSSPVMLRTPIYHNRIMEYLDRYTVPHPDSTSAAARRVVEMAMDSEETFRYVLVTVTNKYETSTMMGMENVFVTLAKEFYLDGDAGWVDPETMEKIEDRVNELEPNLIGKKAPQMFLANQNGEPVNLYSVKGNYTVLYFYDPNCGNCKKKTPIVYDAYEQFKEKNVAFMGICTITKEEDWQNYIKENKLEWINAADLQARSNFRAEYNIVSTPRIFILDEKKKIIARRIGAKDIVPFLSRMMEDSSGD